MCVTLLLSLLTSCKALNTPDYEKITENTTEAITGNNENAPETSVIPEPMAEKTLSTEKIAHSYGVARNGVATVFPQSIAMAASFNKELMFEVASVISDEIRAKYNENKKQGYTERYQGLTMCAPNINIFREACHITKICQLW